MGGEGIQFLILLATAFFVCLLGFLLYFVVLYQNRQLKNRREQEQLQSDFSQELLKTQIEVQEQTLNYISTEIHDNITQVLSFVKLTLAISGNLAEKERKLKISESRDLIAQSIEDLRDLSKSLSFDHIATLGLEKTIEIETDRINKSGLIEAALAIEGEPYPLTDQTELVLFRIFQETLNNALKHAGAKHFKIILQYHSELFNLTLLDDGAGFSPEQLADKSGSGVKNMQNRATLIGGIATIDSSPGNGCCVKVSLNPLKLRLDTDGKNHPDSFG